MNLGVGDTVIDPVICLSIVHSEGYFLLWTVSFFAEGPVLRDFYASNAQCKNQMNE